MEEDKLKCFIAYSQKTQTFYSVYGQVHWKFLIHSLSSFYTSTSISTTKIISFISIITYRIQFFISLHCFVDIPLPQRTIEYSPMKSLEETINTTKNYTLRMTKEIRIDLTIRETQNRTPIRSFDDFVCTNQIAIKREISVILTFSFLFLSQIK